MSGRYDSRQLRRAFGRAAEGYEAAAILQREVETRLLESLEYLDDRVPARVLDIGAGPGRASAAMKKRWPRAEVVALDQALPMLRQARRRAGWLRPFRRVCGDAAALPFADAAFDVAFSSLCLQWAQDLPATLAEIRRVLKPGGLFLMSSFGPQTLVELRQAFAAADGGAPHVSEFAPIQRLGDALVAAGFRDPVLDQDTFTLTYPDVPALMRELRAIGATNAASDRRRALTGKARMRAVFDAYEGERRDGVLLSTWEVVYAQAWSPAPGAPRRGAGGEIASIPVAGIPIRRRGESR
ncbi:malonyl-ACP O-methyltransferase BioC [Coralloluteibacterium stylophorae]|uniref:Malonyl-[acyl-carrier protein] O-methyltransferase n=1 Tax=Coralloluteibacterium stylophorae TaxID=1776034 RepID=A0A8J8AYZ4_9GAMM|nr:malonyl-ACP O-methyltransferase BioC [Coralloluteibacterium stylophorae]MBS7457139.1 malonyl-ACP O-methyltransferase BioC [Coralloluteibacterium stylophorae]